VVIAEDAMSAGDMTEVPRCELPTTQLATTVPTDTSDVPRASVSTASGTPRVPATGAAASHMPTARAPAASTPAPVSHAERGAAVQGEREDDRDAESEERTPEPAQRPRNRRELHGGSLVAWWKGVKGKCPPCKNALLLVPSGLRGQSREREQADLDDEERQALIPLQPRPGRNVDHGLADAGEQVEDGEAVKGVLSLRAGARSTMLAKRAGSPGSSRRGVGLGSSSARFVGTLVQRNVRSRSSPAGSGLLRGGVFQAGAINDVEHHVGIDRRLPNRGDGAGEVALDVR
jgi:hypothetical protein